MNRQWGRLLPFTLVRSVVSIHRKSFRLRSVVTILICVAIRLFGLITARFIIELRKWDPKQRNGGGTMTRASFGGIVVSAGTVALAREELAGEIEP